MATSATSFSLQNATHRFFEALEKKETTIKGQFSKDLKLSVEVSNLPSINFNSKNCLDFFKSYFAERVDVAKISTQSQKIEMCEKEGTLSVTALKVEKVALQNETFSLKTTMNMQVVKEENEAKIKSLNIKEDVEGLTIKSLQGAYEQFIKAIQEKKVGDLGALLHPSFKFALTIPYGERVETVDKNALELLKQAFLDSNVTLELTENASISDGTFSLITKTRVWVEKDGKKEKLHMGSKFQFSLLGPHLKIVSLESVQIVPGYFVKWPGHEFKW